MLTPIEEYVIQIVKKKRLERGWSQQALADNINVSKGFIAHVESPIHRAKYNLNHINEFVKVFGCKFSDLFPDKPL